MDLYCPRCSEPWDFDTLHDETLRRNPQLRDDAPEAGRDASEKGYARAFAQVREDFYTRGCEALDSRCAMPASDHNRDRAAVASAVYDLLGDDLDGAASMLDDAEALGLL